jgi:2-phosphosulfolactate phosphatase
VSAFDQSGFTVRFEWAEFGLRALAATTDVLVIVDVLSFSTATEVAVSRGAVVLPFPSRDAIAAAAFADRENATLAVTRQHLSNAANSDTQRYSLSPVSLRQIPHGTRLVLPSPNGSTLSRIAADRGRTVLAGCLRNASAVAAAAIQVGGSIGVIAAGERWPDGSLRPALEDLVGAGAIISALGAVARSPEAELAAAAFRHVETDLQRALETCASGRELIELGFDADVRLAAELDVGTVAPVFGDGAFHAYGWTV